MTFHFSPDMSKLLWYGFTIKRFVKARSKLFPVTYSALDSLRLILKDIWSNLSLLLALGKIETDGCYFAISAAVASAAVGSVRPVVVAHLDPPQPPSVQQIVAGAMAARPTFPLLQTGQYGLLLLCCAQNCRTTWCLSRHCHTAIHAAPIVPPAGV